MAETIVTKQATVAANLGIETGDARPWVNPERALTSNNFYAVADFGLDSTSVTYRESDYLYLSGWGFDLSAEAKVVGIDVMVERNASGGTVKDYYVGLAYNVDSTLEITSPSKHKVAAWPEGTDATTNYGGAEDFWNRVWTATEINDPEFGFVISTQGHPAENEAANIDFIEMTIHWHQDIYIDPVGGFTCCGSAEVDATYAIADPTGGSVQAGHGSYNHDPHIMSGGFLASGEYEGAHYYWPLGGTIFGGLPVHKVTYHTPDSDGALIVNGTAFIWMMDIVEIGGGIKLGGEWTAVDFIQPVGGSTVNGDKIFDFTYSPVISGGASVDAAAFVDPVIMDGGLSGSGLSVVEAIYHTPTTSEGGITVSGEGRRQDTFVVLPFGIKLDGTATIGITPSSKGGIVVATEPGETALIGPQWETMSGGATANGISFIDPYVPLGGVSLGGGATNTMVMDTWSSVSQPDNFVMTATSHEVVEGGGEDPHGKTVWAHFHLDEADNTSDPNYLEWKILHGFDQEKAYRLQIRIGEVGETGPIWLQIGLVSGWSNPIIGRQQIWPYRIDQLRNGGLYFYARSETDETVRAQITPRTGVKGGGTVPQLYTEFSEGGLTASGESESLLTHNYEVSGGALVSGLPVFGFSMDIRGGALVNGSSIRQVSYNFSPTVLTGVMVNGTAINIASFIEISLGGGIVSGFATPGIQPAIFGGGLVDGSIAFEFYYTPRIRGGALLAGLHKQTFTDFYDGLGGAKVNGRGRAERIKFFTKQHLGYCYAMASENICTTVSYEKELIPPTGDVSPELDPDRFRIQHVGVWCDVEERCEEGVLPKKVQDRQGQYLPPKISRKVVRDRRIATLDAV